MLDKIDPQALTIQVGGEIKQVCLDRSLVAAERGINTDIGDAGNRSLADGNNHGIHAIRQEHVGTWSQVGCGKPQPTTTLEAFFYPPTDRVGTIQEASHFAHLTRTEQGTDNRATDFSAFN